MSHRARERGITQGLEGSDDSWDSTVFPPQDQSPSVFNLVCLMAGETIKGYMFLFLHEDEGG